MSVFKDLFGKTTLKLGTVVAICAVVTYWVTYPKRSRKKSRIIDMIEEFKKSNVHIKDKERVERLVCDLIKGGRDKLQVIMDFDRTITKFKRSDGSTNPCTYNALEDTQYMPTSYKEKSLPLRDKYYAIEIDPNLSLEEKYPFMVEWWTQAHSLLQECNLNRDMIKRIVQDADIVLRDGVDWLLTSLYKAGVPLLIFSAGVGDIIEEVVKQQARMYDNIKIVSNFLDYDEKGQMRGFQGELIHVFNKNESAVHKSDYFEKLSHRENILLMGDSVGDLKMAHGAVNCQNIVKIGFLNDKVDKLLPLYMDLYDIVLVGDESMEIPNAILTKII